MTNGAPSPTGTTIEPVQHDVAVDVPIEEAFDVFMRRLDAWWPRDSHHVGTMRAIAVLEPHVGGCCSSLAEDGTQCDWGRVVAFEPPTLFRMASLLTPEWELEREAAKHAGFERYAAGDGAAMRDQVDGAGGWTTLMDLHAKHADATQTPATA